MSEAIDQLQDLGFSQYEAQAYTALLRNSPANGYELAKASGIPRPNIYVVLQKLEERGAVLRIDSPMGTRYSPVPPTELLAGLKQRFQGAMDSASEALCTMATPTSRDSILNLTGYEVMLDHARSLINTAQQGILISIWPEEARQLNETLQHAKNRGVRIITLCLRGCPQACPACQGDVFRYSLAPMTGRRWLIIAADDVELLAGEITPQKDALAVRTRQKMLVNLTASFIQNSIALAAILNGFGDQVDTLLDPQTRAALDALHPLQARGRWIDVMKEMIHRHENSSTT
jgi:predicted transcriptional regulator